MQHHQDLIRFQPHARLAEQFRTWLRHDANDLVRSAELLGGPVWGRRAVRAIDLAAPGGDPIRLFEAVGQLHRLLSLEMTDDLSSAEAEYFAALDPDHPDADTARMCCEALERVLPSLRLLAAHGIVREAA